VGPGGGITRSKNWEKVWESGYSFYTYEHKKAAWKQLSAANKKGVSDMMKIGKVGPSFPDIPSLPKVKVESLDEELRKRDEWNKANDKVWDEMKEKCKNSCVL
jgi:hypothetical protein